MSDWISVKDKLPEEGETVIFLLGSGNLRHFIGCILSLNQIQTGKDNYDLDKNECLFFGVTEPVFFGDGENITFGTHLIHPKIAEKITHWIRRPNPPAENE